MPDFYLFSDNSVYNDHFTWAMSILNRSKRVDFHCPACGVRKNYPSGAFDVAVEGGREYPDVFGCGSFPFLIVSNAVVIDWTRAGVKSFHTYPVGIAEVRSKQLLDLQGPEYFRVEIDGSCRIDLEASGLRIARQCSKCGHRIIEPSVAPGFRIAEGSWDGSTLFRDKDLYPYNTFCTELVLELARRHRHTNFRFEPMEGPRDPASRGIEYLNG